MDQLATMRAFVAIVDGGSLTAAAKALGKSSPTMVRLLAELERSLGVVLLRRTTRRMSLTAEGQVYLEHCRRIVSDVDELEALMRTGSAAPSGKLRVTAPVLFGQMHVAPAITAFVRAYPGVDVDLLLLDRVVSLVEEGIDVAVRIGRLPDSSMIATAVGEVRHMVCASPELLERVGVPEHPSALTDLPCVRFTGMSSGDVWRFREGSKELTVPVHGNLRVNQASVVVEACAQGLGFGRFLSYQVEPAIEAGRLTSVLEAFEPPAYPVSVVFADARLPTKRMRVFADWLKAHLRGREPPRP